VAALPTGTVTFLFTDIEASTALWQQYPGAMPTALARHHDLLRREIESHQGYVFQIVGDAFCVAFPTALLALKAALAAQRALRDELWQETGPLRVRMALHTGVAEVHAGDYTSGEYASGLTLARTARLLSAGHGGQVLLSQTTRDLVERDMPAGASLIDLGEHRLKDLHRPERLYQVVSADLPSDFPPLKSLDTLSNNLPVQLTSFVGRASDVMEVKRLLTTTRLLTVTGTGGTGKTRLTLAVAADLLDEFADGVWFVELAPVADPNLIPQAVADAVGVRESAGRPLMTALSDYVHAKQMLLILDNCEHLIDASARLAEFLLHTSPQLKILASSREALGIAGEVAYRVPSLSLPKSVNRGQWTVDSEQYPLTLVMQSEAVRLFVERARAVQPHFMLTEQNAEAIAHICERLDGIPLALELASARVGVFPVEQIAARLNDRFRLLTGGSRTAMPRQQTLRAAIDWSYELLCDEERALLRGLSVFAGGWSFEAAEAVVGGQWAVDSEQHSDRPALPTIDMLEMMPRLVNKSLVIADDQGGQARYRMLETVRQFAREELVKAGEAPLLHDRHLAYFSHLAETASNQMYYREGLFWLNRLETEHDNVLRALAWALESHPDRALEFASYLWEFWARRGYATEGRRWLEQALERVEALPPEQGDAGRRRESIRANALVGLGRLILVQGEDLALALKRLDQGIALAHSLGDEGLTAHGLALRGLGAIFVGDWDSADASTREAVDISKRIEDRVRLGLAFGIRSQFLLRAGRDQQEAMSLSQASALISDELGMGSELTGLRYGIAYVALTRKDYAEARIRFNQGLVFFHDTGDKQFENMSRSGLGDVARLEGNYTEAIPHYWEALAVWQKMGRRGAVARLLECFAFIASAQGRNVNPPELARLETAIRLLGAADALRQIADSQMVPEETTEYTSELVALKGAVDEEIFHAAWAEGRKLTMEQAIAYARQEMPYQSGVMPPSKGSSSIGASKE
jgi:predicted ATPase/class 3 adenylate cyclase